MNSQIKLQLKKETVRRLADENLDQVQGGIHDFPSKAPVTKGSIGNNCPCCAIPVTD